MDAAQGKQPIINAKIVNKKQSIVNRLPVNALRAKAGICVAFSTDIISLRETVARRAFISVAQCITRITVARRAFTRKRQFEMHPKKQSIVNTKIVNFFACS
jgi:hypothetical protein